MLKYSQAVFALHSVAYFSSYMEVLHVFISMCENQRQFFTFMNYHTSIVSNNEFAIADVSRRNKKGLRFGPRSGMWEEKKINF